MSGPGELDAAILQAHREDDRVRLAQLYFKAGDIEEQAGDIDAACFFYTIAYVYGLETEQAEPRDQAHARLVTHGREA